MHYVGRVHVEFISASWWTNAWQRALRQLPLDTDTVGHAGANQRHCLGALCKQYPADALGVNWWTQFRLRGRGLMAWLGQSE